jgi:hypothetical protein
MIIVRGFRRVACVALATLIGGCPHQLSAIDASVHDAFVVPDAGPPQPESVTVAVVDPTGPIDGATVTIDDALGARHVATTASDGHATLPGVAWSPAAVTITASAPHHPMQTLAGFRRSDLGDRADASGTITIGMTPYFTSVRVSGNVRNVDASSMVMLSQDVPGRLVADLTAFAGTVARDVPFRVFGMAGAPGSGGGFVTQFTLAAIVEVDHAALTADATFDIDFASPLPLTTVRGTLPYPPAGSPLERIYPTIYVSTDESELEARIGRSTSIEVNATNLGFTVQYAAGVSGAVVTRIGNGDGTLSAEVVVDGAPTALPIERSSDWPVPPRLVSPSIDATASLHDPITLSGVDATLPIRATVYDASTTRWYIELPPGGDTMSIPDVPLGTDTTGWVDVQVRIDGCERWRGHHIHCRRLAGGDTFRATAP